jgi:superfamily II DNA or RNA helicase
MLLRSAPIAEQPGIPGMPGMATTRVTVARKKKKQPKPSLRIPPPNQKEVVLYDYQKKIIKDAYNLVRKGSKKIGIFAGGGSGKTTVAASMIRDACQRSVVNKKCLFIVDQVSLIEQSAKNLLMLNVPCATLQGSGRIYRDAPVIVASAQTIEARLEKGATLENILGIIDGPIFVDEAHRTLWRVVVEKVCDYYIESHGAILFGMTASPFRSSPDEYLGQKLTHAVEGPPIPSLIRLKKLSPSRDFGIGQAIDYTQLDTGKDGDYNAKSVEKALSGNDDYVVKQWERICAEVDPGREKPRPTVVFGPTVNASKKMAEAFNRAGYTAEWQSGSTSDDDRNDQDKRLKSGETVVLCSCNTVTVGWDLPEIECVIYNKISKSKANFFQAAWRGSRIAPWAGKKDFILIDVGGNLKRLGHPMEATDYYIGPPRRRSDSDAERTMVKECPNCGAEVLIFAQVCECGHEFGSDEDDGDDETQQNLLEDDLVEIFSTERRKEIRFLRTEKRRCYKEGRSPSEAIALFVNEHKYSPPREWHIGAVFSKSLGKINKERYRKFLYEVGESSGKSGDTLEFWVNHEIKLEFGTPAQIGALLQGDWQQTLGVLPEDSRATAKRKYLDLMKSFHPDHASSGDDAIMSESEAAEFAKKINQAWDDAKRYYECV